MIDLYKLVDKKRIVEYLNLQRELEIEPDTLFDFVKTGKSEFCVGKRPVVLDNACGCYVLHESGGLVSMNSSTDHLWFNEIQDANDRHLQPPTAMLTPADKGYDLVLNGDEDYSDLVGAISAWDYPTISFDCATQIIFTEKRHATLAKQSRDAYIELARMFQKGEITVVDFVPDQWKEFTATEKKAFQKWKRECKKAKKNTTRIPKVEEYLSTPPGYTYGRTGGVSNQRWHQAATVVLRNTRSLKCYLLGQDEGTYFGLELPENVDSVKEAYRCLMPEKIRRKKGVERQGEWFVVPVKSKDVPELNECIAIGCEDVCLPLQDTESNPHTVTTDDGAWNRSIRISDEGVFAHNGRLTHEEHGDVRFHDWVKFVCSTAVRSVSQEGVD